MRRFFVALSTMLGLAIAAPSGARLMPPAPAYLVQMELFRGGRQIAAPQIRMHEGASTTMRSEGQGGYSIRVELARLPGSGDRIRVATQIRLEHEGQWPLAASPELIMPIGRRAEVEIASPAGAAGAGPLRFAIRVVPGAAPHP